MKHSFAIFSVCLVLATSLGAAFRADDQILFADIPEMAGASGPKASPWIKLVATVELERSLFRQPTGNAWDRLMATVFFWRPTVQEPLAIARYTPPRVKAQTVVVADHLDSNGHLPFVATTRFGGQHQAARTSGTYDPATGAVVRWN